jgi:thiamine-monophosphate kinase
VFKADPNMQPDLQGFDYVLERQLKPEAKTNVTDILKNLKIKPHAMIDISDGLASDLMHICKQSKVGCHVYEEKIPIDITTASLAEEFNIDPTTAALNGGEDYELLFTIPMQDFEKIKDNSIISTIGHIVNENEGMNLISKSGSQVPLKAQGWDALNK